MTFKVFSVPVYKYRLAIFVSVLFSSCSVLNKSKIMRIDPSDDWEYTATDTLHLLRGKDDVDYIARTEKIKSYCRNYINLFGHTNLDPRIRCRSCKNSKRARFRYEISGIEDTVSAKAFLIAKLSERYGDKFYDSTIIFKIYNLSVPDSTKLCLSEYGPEHEGTASKGNYSKELDMTGWIWRLRAYPVEGLVYWAMTPLLKPHGIYATYENEKEFNDSMRDKRFDFTVDDLHVLKHSEADYLEQFERQTGVRISLVHEEERTVKVIYHCQRDE